MDMEKKYAIGEEYKKIWYTHHLLGKDRRWVGTTPDGRNNSHVKQKEHSSLNELHSFKTIAFIATNF